MSETHDLQYYKSKCEELQKKNGIDISSIKKLIRRLS